MNLPFSVTQSELFELLLNLAPSRPVFIWGAPGIGKSALVQKFADEVGLPCVSLLGSQLAPEDIIGIPQIRGNTSEFLPPKMIARREPYVLFLDELNACSQEVQKAFYSLIHRSYARPSRRQGSTPDIPRPRYVIAEMLEHDRTFGVVVDTSGSMDTKMLGYALGAIASYSAAREVPYARVVFCDANAYDAGYMAPEDIAGRVAVKGRGGTILQPGVNLLLAAKDFQKDATILLITDGYIESQMRIPREHAFLIPKGHRLPFRAKGKMFYFSV